MSWRPVMNATLSLVPTPSALGRQHRLAIAIAIEAEQAAERSDIRQHAGRERRTRASDLNAADASRCRRRCRPAFR